MKPFIILAALGLLILTLGCVPEGSGLAVPAQNDAAAGETLSPLETATPSPPAEPAAGAAVSPVVIRDAWRGGMDSLERELIYPQGGQVLLALPQTAAEDLHCNPRHDGGAGCSIKYYDPESAKYQYAGNHWSAGIAFSELEAAIAFRETIGKGPVTVSCFIPQDWGGGGIGFQNCEVR